MSEKPSPVTVRAFDGQLFTWHVATPTAISGGSTSTDDGFDYSVEP